jgi:predicted Zn-dependent protease
MISRRNFTLGLCSCASGLTGACMGTTDDGRPVREIASLPPGFRPENLSSDEAGLWLTVQKAEDDVKRSPIRINSKKIMDFIDDVTCRISGNYCKDMRKYVIREPTFNAGMYPTGMMVINTGFLLRCNSESQVASVLGHEFGHYLRRHGLQGQRNRVAAMDGLAVFGLGVAAVGLSPRITDMAGIIAIGNVFAYGRDQEREADAVGMEKMVEAGYDPFEAAEIWSRLKRERDAVVGAKQGDPFFATHPAIEERLETLRSIANAKGRPAVPPPNRLMAAIEDIRIDLLLDEIKKNRHEQTLELFNMQQEDGQRLGEVLFAKGELFRYRNKPDDIETAVKLYQDALADKFAPPETHRSLGLMHHKAGRKNEAATHLRRYLALKPDAVDKQMLLSYIGGA